MSEITLDVRAAAEPFTCRSLNWRMSGQSCFAWAIDGPAGEPHDIGSGRAFCGTFPDEQTARDTARRWNETGGEAVRIGWSAAATDYGGDRGTYHLSFTGTRWHRSISNDMEGAARIAGEMRDKIAAIGLEVVRATIKAANG